MSKHLLLKIKELEEKRLSLKRCLDVNYYNKEIRNSLFEQINEIEKEIEKVKFKLTLEREIKKNGE